MCLHALKVVLVARGVLAGFVKDLMGSIEEQCLAPQMGRRTSIALRAANKSLGGSAVVTASAAFTNRGWSVTYAGALS